MEGNRGGLGPPAPVGAITSWLGAYPLRDAEPDTVVALVDDVLAFCEPYGVESVDTSEPRTYRLTPRGRARLTDALRQGRVEMLVVGSPIPLTRPAPPPHPSVYATVSLFDTVFPMANAAVGLTVEPGGPATAPSVATQLVELIGRWFAPLRGLSAFVSWARQIDYTTIGDQPEHTAVERECRAPPLMLVPLLQVYARGVFWGNGLGADLCARLGGVERVLAQAPVPVARRLGDGVWLQLGGAPPPDPTDLARLATYLGPLVDWTREDVQARVRAFLAANPSLVSPPPVAPAPPPAAPPAGRARHAPRIPVRWLPGLGEDSDVGLNVHLPHPPSAAQRAQIEAIVAAWYQRGFDGAFGGVGFHYAQGPTVDGPILRWFVDLGSADPRRAIRDLTEQLVAQGLPVSRLVIGTETAG